MDLVDVQEKKEDLRMELFKKINDFESETGVMIEAIELKHHKSVSGSFRLAAVTIDARLPGK